MTDLKALAYELLGEARSILQNQGFVNPAAVVITPSKNLIFDLEFETDDERDELYAEMMDVAKQKSASAILTTVQIADSRRVTSRLPRPKPSRSTTSITTIACRTRRRMNAVIDCATRTPGRHAPGPALDQVIACRSRR